MAAAAEPPFSRLCCIQRYGPRRSPLDCDMSDSRLNILLPSPVRTATQASDQSLPTRCLVSEAAEPHPVPPAASAAPPSATPADLPPYAPVPLPPAIAATLSLEEYDAVSHALGCPDILIVVSTDPEQRQRLADAVLAATSPARILYLCADDIAAQSAIARLTPRHGSVIQTDQMVTFAASDDAATSHGEHASPHLRRKILEERLANIHQIQDITLELARIDAACRETASALAAVESQVLQEADDPQTPFGQQLAAQLTRLAADNGEYPHRRTSENAAPAVPAMPAVPVMRPVASPDSPPTRPVSLWRRLRSWLFGTGAANDSTCKPSTATVAADAPPPDNPFRTEPPPQTHCPTDLTLRQTALRAEIDRRHHELLRQLKQLRQQHAILQEQREGLIERLGLPNDDHALLEQTAAHIRHEIEALPPQPSHPPAPPHDRQRVVIGTLTVGSAKDQNEFMLENTFDRIIVDGERMPAASIRFPAKTLILTTDLATDLPVAIWPLPDPAATNGTAPPYGGPCASQLARHAVSPYSPYPYKIFHRPMWTRATNRWVYHAPLSHPANSSWRCEPLADNPEIELRFLDLSERSTELAEIVFPPDWELSRALSWLAATLEVLAVRACGPRVWSTQQPLRVCWPIAEAAMQQVPETIELANGIRAAIHCRRDTPYLVWLEFNPQHGWERATAEAWIEHVVPQTTINRLFYLAETSD